MLNIRHKANVTSSSSRTIHSIGTIIDGDVVPIKNIATPDHVCIAEDSEGVFLFRFNVQGVCIADTWHESIASAKEQANFEYSIQNTDWEDI